MKTVLRITLLCSLLNATNAMSFWCFTSEKKLKELPQKIAQNFSVSIYEGPNFGKKRKLKSYIDTIKNCSNKIERLGLDNCLSKDILPVMETTYRKLKLNYWNSNLQFEISDKSYLKSIPKQAMSLPPELQNGLPDNWRELVAQNPNWTGLEYASRTVQNPPGPNRSYNRVLIKVSEGPYDKWIQFTMPQKCRPKNKILSYTQDGYACDINGVMRKIPEDYDPINPPGDLTLLPEIKKQEKLVDYIAVNRESNPQKIYFNQLWRDDNGQNPHQRGQYDTCYTCHPNGMRQLSPLPGSVSKQDLPALDELRDEINGYSKLDWGPAINPKGYGPPVGRLQGCTQCHNNNDRGALNYMTEKGHIDHKIHGDFSMNGSNRKKYKDFLQNMERISQYISEDDRREIQDIIQEINMVGKSNPYEEILNYLEKNNVQVPFDIKDYKNTLESLNARNEKISTNDLFANYEQEFNDYLFGRCNPSQEQNPDQTINDSVNNIGPIINDDTRNRNGENSNEQ